jgi:hypothetical protein
LAFSGEGDKNAFGVFSPEEPFSSVIKIIGCMVRLILKHGDTEEQTIRSQKEG